MSQFSDLARKLLKAKIAGKYLLTAIRSQGQFGTVFTAHQFFFEHFVRVVAVKISHQTHLTEKTAAHLFSDALVLARLMAGSQADGKKHLVPIYDMGLLPEHEGRGFLVMEHVDGHRLLSHIQAAGQISVPSGLRYLKEICSALALIHSQGAVHRDLKPDNMLVDNAGVVRLVDFGLAAFTDPSLGFAPGSLGTFTYMAPETLLGRSTPAADIYSLGLVAYELFTGSGPHLTAPWPTKKDEQSTARDHFQLKKNLQFSPPSEVHNEIRNEYRWLDEVILRCLAVEPLHRFQNGGELLEAIYNCLAGHQLPPVDTKVTSDHLQRQFDEVAKPPELPKEESSDPLVTDARKLLSRKAFAEVIDHLDIHQPAEWAVVDEQGARILRLLGMAYLGKKDFARARDCLVQLRLVQKEKPVLPVEEYLAGLTDLHQCFQHLKMAGHAEECHKEIKELGQDYWFYKRQHRESPSV